MGSPRLAKAQVLFEHLKQKIMNTPILQHSDRMLDAHVMIYHTNGRGLAF